MYPEGIFPGDVIHTEEVVDSLPGQKCAEPLGREATIVKPVDVPGGVISPALVWHGVTHDQQVAGRRGRIDLGRGPPGVLLDGSSSDGGGGGCRWKFSLACCDHSGITRKKCFPAEEVLSHLSEDVISTLYKN